MTRKEDRGSASLKTTYVLSPFKAGCYAVPIPDIPEAAWLASGSVWLILEQHVLHSSNHLSQPQARQSTTATTRQSFVPVNLHPEKVLWNFIHIRKETFFHPFLQGLSSFSCPWHFSRPPQPHDVVQFIPVPHSAGWDKDERKLENPQEHPWEIDACLGKHLPWFSFLLSKQPILSNKHMGSQ